MDFTSDFKLNWLFRLKAQDDKNFLYIQVILFSCLKLRFKILKGRKFSCQKINHLKAKYTQAVLIFDHQWGGGV